MVCHGRGYLGAVQALVVPPWQDPGPAVSEAPDMPPIVLAKAPPRNR